MIIEEAKLFFIIELLYKLFVFFVKQKAVDSVNGFLLCSLILYLPNFTFRFLSNSSKNSSV